MTKKEAQKVTDEKLMTLYALVVPCSDLPFSTYKVKTREIYDTMLLKDSIPRCFSYDKFLDEMLKNAQKKIVYS